MAKGKTVSLIKVLAFITLAAAFANGNAQEAQNQFLLDASPVFTGSPTLNFQYRRAFARETLRLAVTLMHDDDESQSTTRVTAAGSSQAILKQNTSTWETGLRAGYQKQADFESFFCYYGADLHLSQSSSSYEGEEVISGGVGVPRTVNTSETMEWQFGIVPVFGIGHQFNKHFSLQAESGFGIYRNNTSTSIKKSYYFKAPNGTEALNNTEVVTADAGGYHISFATSRYFRVFLAWHF